MVEKKKRLFLPKVKNKAKVEMKELNQRRMNVYFIGGLVFIILLAVLSIGASLLRSTQDNSPQSTVVLEKSDEIDNRLQIFLESYLYTYFNYTGENITDYQDALDRFYNFSPDTKVTNVPKAMKLISHKLERLKDGVAVYRVTYETEEQRVTVLFGIPFGGDDGQYYISGLPYYEAVKEYKSEEVDKDMMLTLTGTDKATEEERKVLTEFLELFFKNYTTSQENLNVISKDIDSINGAVFQTIDYSYFKIKDKEHIVAYVQASFEILGSVHSENFTFDIRQKEDGSFFVDKMIHSIPSDYDKKE